MDAKRWASISTAACLALLTAEAYARQCPAMPPPPDTGGAGGPTTGGGGPSRPTTGGGGPATTGGGSGGPTTGGGGSGPSTGGGGGKTPATGGGTPPQNPGPSDTQGPPTTGGNGPGPIGGGGPAPSSPSGGPAGGGPSTGPTGGGPRPGSGPQGPTGGPQLPKGGAAGLTGKRNKNTVTLDRWDLWWDLNCEGFLAARSATAPQTARERGFLDGVGFSTQPAVNTRPTRSVVVEELVPALRVALKDRNNYVRAAAATALGRIAPTELRDESIESLSDALHSEDATVRDSALLAIGLLGDRSVVRTLWQVMNDTLEARALMNSAGGVQDKERAFAILGLGLLGGREAATQFEKLLARSATKDVEVAGAAVLALGMLGAEAQDFVPRLGEMLCDRSLDRRLRAQIPVTLARIGEPALPVLPYLLQLSRDQKEDALVRSSCVIGLGRLAATYDAEILAVLRDLAHEDRDPIVRHYALLGLAQIGARATDSTPKDVLGGIARYLTQELEKPRNTLDQPWAALACGIFAGSLKTVSTSGALRQNLVEEMRSTFRSISNPSTSGALAIGLGLAAAKDSTEDVRARFAKESDDSLRGHFALALGLLGDDASIESLRNCLKDEGRPELRESAARALALLHDSESLDSLLSRLEGTPTAVEARSLARAVARLKDPGAATRLARLAADPKRDSSVRSACCEAIGLLAERTEIPYTARLTGDLNVHSGLNAAADLIAKL